LTVQPAPSASIAAARSVDYVARLAAAWNLEGRHCFAVGGREHRALLSLAYLPADLEKRSWDQLTEEQRRRLFMAARQAVEFGRACAWVFGEGQGA
jgi:hypothetical protein